MKIDWSLFTGMMMSVALLLVSCESSLDRLVIEPDAGAPGQLATDRTDPFTCTAENATTRAFTFSWSKASFGESISSTYVLQLDVPGNQFAAPYEINAGGRRQYEMLSEELNRAMHRLQQPISTPTDIEVRVKASPIVLGSSPVEVPYQYSGSVLINVSSYAMPPLFLIGSMFDNFFAGDPLFWNNSSYQYVMFRNDPLSLDVYTARFFGYDAALSIGEFALLETLGSWTMINKGAQSGTLKQGGVNIHDITTTGYYTLTVNLSNMTYTIAPFDAGSALEYDDIQLTGLDAPLNLSPMHNNPHIWTVDNVRLEAGETLRFVAPTAPFASWGSGTFPWGKGTESGTDIPVNQAGDYFIKFNDLTGQYVFYKIH